MTNYTILCISGALLLLIIFGDAFAMAQPPKKNHTLTTEEIDAINKRCYDINADYWHRLPFADFLPQWIIEFHNPAAGYQALDIGSGTGLLAGWLKKSGFDVLCIDPSDEMVRRSRELGLETIQSTLQQFSTERKFGLIIAVLSLIHVSKHEMRCQIKRIANWLVPGGTFALAMIEGKGEGVGENKSSYPRYFSYYTKEEILNLRSEDFECLACRKTGAPISYLVFIFRKK